MQEWCRVNTPLQLGELLGADSEMAVAQQGTGDLCWLPQPVLPSSLSTDTGTSPLLSCSPEASIHLHFTPSCTHECL